MHSSSRRDRPQPCDNHVDLAWHNTWSMAEVEGAVTRRRQELFWRFWSGWRRTKGMILATGADSHFRSLSFPTSFRNNPVNHSQSFLPHSLLPSSLRASQQCLFVGTSPNGLLSTPQYTLTPRNHPPSPLHLIIMTLQAF